MESADSNAALARVSAKPSLQLWTCVRKPVLSERLRCVLGTQGGCHVSLFAAPTAHGEVPAIVVCLVDPATLVDCCRLVQSLQVAWPGVPVLTFTELVPFDGLMQLVACGAYDFAELSASDAELRLRVRRALGLLDAHGIEPAVGVGDVDPVIAAINKRLIGRAPAFVKLLRRVAAMASSDASVLLTGETGTGKEVCAQAIHYASRRARGPWVAINCAAIPPELVEDELFGHVRGAYTHAIGSRQGLVREAEGGTLFLDEIDSMPLAAQAKLLRFLQDKQYRVVGASALHSADVRVVAASNRDLRLAAASHTFRQDLFFRLNVLGLTLPPLRERREDIAMLALHFLGQANHEARRHLVGLTPAALRALQAHEWPGNVRELKHALQRAVLTAQGCTVKAEDIELDGAAPVADGPVSFRDAKAQAVESFERSYLEQLLVQNDGNISRAALAAQKNRRAFFELLRRHSINAERYRGAH